MKATLHGKCELGCRCAPGDNRALLRFAFGVERRGRRVAGVRLTMDSMESTKSGKHAAVARTGKGKPAARLEVLREAKFSALPWLAHGFSTRPGGYSTAYGKRSLNLGFTAGDEKPAVEKNRAAYVKALTGERGGKPVVLVTLQQVHSDFIHVITEFPNPSMTPNHPLAGDGMVTSVPGLLLAIQTADCLPILLVDKKQRVVAAVHAGWRGSLHRIAQKTVGTMQSRFSSDPKNILAAIGPGIHRCCYPVGAEVRQEFESQFDYAGELFDEVFDSDPVHLKYPLLFLTARAPGHSELGPQTHFDLVEANRRQLQDAGIPAKNVTASPLCTGCRADLLFSHRMERGNTGRMMAAIGIRP